MFPFSTRQLSFEFKFRRPQSAPSVPDLATGDAGILHNKRISSTLSMLLGEGVEVVFTNNRATMISFRKKSGVLHLRLHNMFQEADERVLKALSVFVTGIPSKRASRILDAFIHENRHRIQTDKKTRRMAMQPEGEHIDLTGVLHRVADRYFAGQVDGVKIGWGRQRTSRKRRSRTVSRALATYCFQDTTIRVNPVLDAARVPEFFIDWVIYHELLHHVVPVDRTKKRVQYHNARFRALERAFAFYDKARTWEKEHLEWLVK